MKIFPASLAAAFNLGEETNLTALTGGGGKTSLMFSLGTALKGGAILTTTTKLYLSQTEKTAFYKIPCGPEGCKGFTESDKSRISLLLKRNSFCLITGQVLREYNPEKVSGLSVEMPAQLFEFTCVRNVIVEADGSAGRPFKVPAEHEPAIPEKTSRFIPVLGMDLFEGPIKNKVHRPELALSLLERLGIRAEPESVMSAEQAAHLLLHPEGGLKAAPGKAEIIPFINKADTAEKRNLALSLAEQLLNHPMVNRVVVGKLLPIPEIVLLEDA